MTLTELRERAIKACPYYVGGVVNKCNGRISETCFLWEDDKLPDECRYFERAFPDISLALLQQIWGKSRRRTGEKELLRKAIINTLLEKGEVCQRKLVEQNLLPERNLKYHWPAIMKELGLTWKRGPGANWRYKFYRVTYRGKRELRRNLGQNPQG